MSEGSGPGSIINRPTGSVRLRARFGATGQEAIERVELIANGGVLMASHGEEVIHEFEFPAGGWVAVRCLDGGRLLAHTSPVYVQVEGTAPRADRAAIAFLDGHLQRTRDWVLTEGRFTRPKSREHLLEIIDAARQQLSARVGI